MVDSGERHIRIKKVRDLSTKGEYEVIKAQYNKTLQGDIVTIYDHIGHGYRDICPGEYEYLSESNMDPLCHHPVEVKE